MDTQTLPLVAVGYKVIGHGSMPDKPMEIGGWWVTPSDQYQGDIPREAKEEVYQILKSIIPVGLVILEDMEKIKAKEKKELDKIKREEAKQKALETGIAIGQVLLGILAVVGTVALTIGMVALYAMAYDPILVAVLEDGRWVSLYEWDD